MTQELRRLAEAATQGEWKWDGNVCDYDPYHESPWLVDEKDSYPPILGGQIKCANPANASYIAAANPAAILELLDRLEKAEKDAARYQWLRDTGTQGFSNGVPQRGVTIAMDGSVKLHFVYWMTQQQLNKSIDEAMEASK